MKIHKMPKATLNHLKIFPLNRIIVPIKNQSYLESLAIQPVPRETSRLSRFFHVGFLWLKALSCKSLLISIVLTQVSNPNRQSVLDYSSHLHLPNSADFSLTCMTRGDQAKGPTLREEFAREELQLCLQLDTNRHTLRTAQTPPELHSALAWKAHSHVSTRLWRCW